MPDDIESYLYRDHRLDLEWADSGWRVVIYAPFGDHLVADVPTTPFAREREEVLRRAQAIVDKVIHASGSRPETSFSSPPTSPRQSLWRQMAKRWRG